MSMSEALELIVELRRYRIKLENMLEINATQNNTLSKNPRVYLSYISLEAMDVTLANVLCVQHTSAAYNTEFRT